MRDLTRGAGKPVATAEALTLRMSSGLDSARSSIEVPPSGHATITGPCVSKKKTNIYIYVYRGGKGRKGKKAFGERFKKCIVYIENKREKGEKAFGNRFKIYIEVYL